MTEVTVSKLKIESKGITLVGQSIAGIRSCIAVPELDICFDCGVCTNASVSQSIVLISHGHADHIGALHEHAFARTMNNVSNPTYIMPKNCVDAFNIAHTAFKCMNRDVDPNIVHPWMTRQYKILSESKNTINNLIIESYPTIHGVPSQAFVISKQITKLKPEYVGIDHKTLGSYVKNGLEIKETKNQSIIACGGDTIIDGILQHK
jgi:ribonuclease BN (tRNA processing enzyme)